MTGPVIGYCMRCATTVTATEHEACACPKDGLVYHSDVDSILATRDVCAYCTHPVDHHGTTTVGCADCDCGYDGDFHPDPPRGDE